MEPDFDRPFDRDAHSKEQWAEVPEAIRKIVEQHVAARLPTKILAKLRDLHARGNSIASDDAFFHFGGGMAIRNLAEVGSVTGIWLPTPASAAIGTIATLGFSPRSPQRRSRFQERRSAQDRANSSSASLSPP